MHARSAVQRLRAGKRREPHFGIGSESMAQMLATLRPHRLDLLAPLREQGPTTVTVLGRDYTNEYGDINALFARMGIDDQGRVFVTWDEIDIWRTLTRQAARSTSPRRAAMPRC